MPYTVPLAPLPTAWPNAQAQLVDENGKPTPQFLTLLRQIQEYLAKADLALDEVEP